MSSQWPVYFKSEASDHAECYCDSVKKPSDTEWLGGNWVTGGTEWWGELSDRGGLSDRRALSGQLGGFPWEQAVAENVLLVKPWQISSRLVIEIDKRMTRENIVIVFLESSVCIAEEPVSWNLLEG